MAAAGLPYQVALDDALVLTAPTGVVEISSALMQQQTYPGTSSLSQLQFQNIKLSGASSLFDSQAFVEYDLTVSASLADGVLLPGVLFNLSSSNVSASTISIDNSTYPILGAQTTNIPNVCFRQLPLSTNTQSLSVSLNNANAQNYQLQQELALMDALPEDAKVRLSGLCAVDKPKGVVIPDWYTVTKAASATAGMSLVPDNNYKGGYRQPNNPVWNGGRNYISVKSVSAVGSGAVYSVVYTIREPILADPFTVGYSGPAIGNINSISITYSIDASQQLTGMFCATKDFFSGASAPVITNLTVLNITGANLIMRTYNVDPSVVNIPPVLYYDFNGMQFNQTECPTPVGSTDSKTTTVMNLSTVPKLYYAKICQLPNGLTATTQQIGARVTQAVFNYGTMGYFTLNEVQLYEAYVRNCKDNVKTFSEWKLDCQVIINPAIDLMNNAQSFTGISNSSGLTFSVQYNYDVSNLRDGSITISGALNIQEMFIYAGSLAVGGGLANYSQTTISSAQLIASLDKPLVSNKALHGAHGVKNVRAGGIFSSLGNVLRGAVSAAPALLNTASGVIGAAQGALNHPIVQSALGALGAGSGGQLMYSSRRARR